VDGDGGAAAAAFLAPVVGVDTVDEVGVAVGAAGDLCRSEDPSGLWNTKNEYFVAG
jgi:hypothetical protein